MKYVLTGQNPYDWAESPPLGPFNSEAEARRAIREDLEARLDGCEMLSPGRDDNWFELYTIVEVLNSFRPSINVSVDITLKKK